MIEESKEHISDPTTTYLKDIECRTYVIAGDYNQFLHWCSLNNPNKDRVVYVSSEQKLRGIDPKSNMVFYGTYYDRKDFHAIKYAIDLLRGMIKNEPVVGCFKSQTTGPSS